MTVDLRETCVDRSSTSGEITPGESEWGEVETPEARRAEVIYSRRSVGDTRQQIAYFRSGEKEMRSRGMPEVDPHHRMRGMWCTILNFGRKHSGRKGGVSVGTPERRSPERRLIIVVII
jgi:hypothetical protein